MMMSQASLEAAPAAPAAQGIFEPEVPTHTYEYRDGDGNIVAEFDDLDARNTVRRTLIEDGYRTLRAYVRGVKALGSYGDVG